MEKKLVGAAFIVCIGLLVFTVIFNDIQNRKIDASLEGLDDEVAYSHDELMEELSEGDMTDIFRASVYNDEPEEPEEETEIVVEKVPFTVTKIAPAVTMYVNDTLNVRDGADVSYDRIGRLYWASKVTVTGKTDTGWYQINYKDMTAYVSGDYVQNESPVITSPVVFVGDSRTVQMQKAVAKNEYTWIGKVGMGYSWFATEAVPLVDAYTGEGTKLVINMGVNDIKNYNKYIKLVNSKIDEWDAAGAEVYYASVNPVIDGKCNASNAEIETFNSALRNGLDSRIKWIDSYSYLSSNGFATSDGLHYSKGTYQLLYAYYLSCLSES